LAGKFGARARQDKKTAGPVNRLANRSRWNAKTDGELDFSHMKNQGCDDP